MVDAAKQLREFIEAIGELEAAPNPDTSHIPASRKKSHIVPGTPKDKLKELIVGRMDDIFRKMAEMEEGIDPVIRQEIEAKILELVAFARDRLQ